MERERDGFCNEEEFTVSFSAGPCAGKRDPVCGDDVQRSEHQ